MLKVNGGRQFDYIVQDSRCDIKTGVIEAVDVDGAIHVLQSDGKLILSIMERDDASPAQKFLARIAGGVGEEELLMFARELRMLLKGGVPIMVALRLLSGKFRHRRLNEAIDEVARHVAAGRALSAGMRNRDDVFPPLLCALTRVGEECGRIPASLEHYERYAQRLIEVKRNLVGIMTYPVIVLLFAASITAFLCVKVIPTFEKVYATLHAELPLTTQGIIALSNLLRDSWVGLSLLGVGGILILLEVGSTPAGLSLWGRVREKIPLFGPLLRDALHERFFATMAVLVSSGVGIYSALHCMRGVFQRDPIVSRAIDDIIEGLRRGQILSAALRASGVFSPLDCDSVRVGEEGGTIVEAMSIIAEIHQEQLDFRIRQLARALEPVFVAVLGGVVGFIMLALYQPMMSLTVGVGR